MAMTRRLFGSGHGHAWKMELSRRGTPVSSSHGHGVVRRNHFLLEYEYDPGFRAFVDGRIRSGALTRARAAALCAVGRPPRAPGVCPAHPASPPSTVPPVPAPDPALEKLRTFGAELFRAYYGADDQGWYW